MGSTKDKISYGSLELSEEEKNMVCPENQERFQGKRKKKPKNLYLALWMFNNHAFLFLLLIKIVENVEKKLMRHFAFLGIPTDQFGIHTSSGPPTGPSQPTHTYRGRSGKLKSPGPVQLQERPESTMNSQNSAGYGVVKSHLHNQNHVLYRSPKRI